MVAVKIINRKDKTEITLLINSNITVLIRVGKLVGKNQYFPRLKPNWQK